MLNILFLILILYHNQLTSCCCSRPKKTIQIKNRVTGKTYHYKLLEKNTLAHLRAEILKHQSAILLNNQWLKYKETDYYIAVYNQRGDKILNISNSTTKLSEFITQLSRPFVTINVAPLPYCDTIEIIPAKSS